MSAVVSNGLSVDGARRLTERIRLVAKNVADNVEKLRDLVSEARESDVHQVLGYASWTAYLKDVFGDEPLRLARDVRQELVAELSAQGMSARAIAPIVGVSASTVKTDVQVARTGHVKAADPRPMVNPSTGEVTDEPRITTATHTVKTVTGLDGKKYMPMPPKKSRSANRDLSIINDIRLYLRAIGKSHEIARLSQEGKQHIIDALNDTITQLERSQS